MLTKVEIERRTQRIFNLFVVLLIGILILYGLYRMEQRHEREKAAWQAQIVTRTQYIPVPVVRTVEVTPQATPKGEVTEHWTYAGIFTAAAYSADYACCGKYPDDPGYGITASGTTATEGRTIAADWSILPEGTKVYISGVGYRIVEDKGGAVNGNSVDVYFEEYEDAVNFGLQELKVWVIS